MITDEETSLVGTFAYFRWRQRKQGRQLLRASPRHSLGVLVVIRLIASPEIQLAGTQEDLMKRDTDDREPAFSQRRLLMLVGVIVVTLLVGYFGYRWIARDVGGGKIGNYYKQADEIDK
jgi:hypothetical protein